MLDGAARAGADGPLPGVVKPLLVAEVIAVYLVMMIQMRRRGLRDIIAACRIRGAAAQDGDPGSPKERQLVAQRLGGAVGQTLALLPTDSRCLIQALVLTRLLAARGISSTFIIGARSAPEFAAHAWVECEGTPALPSGGFREYRLLEL